MLLCRTLRMQRANIRRTLTYGVLFVAAILIVVRLSCRGSGGGSSMMVPSSPVQYMYDNQNRAYPYDRLMPIIFIGGMPRSGTTLMRAILDAHPDVRCGEETRVIPRILGLKAQWQKSDREAKRLVEAGLTEEVLSSALAAFILEVIAKHAEPARRLCNKDPFTLKSTIELSKMFPNARFLLMIRDGRAVVNSIMSRGVTISGFDLKNFKSCLEKWNAAMDTMYMQCMRVGPTRCMPVYYEQLVLHPEKMTRKILEFVDVPWNEIVLHHETLINKPGGVSLSKVERSTDQVIKPINLEALTRWVSSVPADVKANIRKIAPMLEKLGYDPDAYPPNYGQADKFVQDNTLEVKKNEKYWQQKAIDVQSHGKIDALTNNATNGSNPLMNGVHAEVIDDEIGNGAFNMMFNRRQPPIGGRPMGAAPKQQPFVINPATPLSVNKTLPKTAR